MSKTGSGLAGLHVLNTRPASDAAALTAALQAAGATVSELPLLVMQALEPGLEAHYRLMELDRYDYVFFVSSSAARIGLGIIGGYWAQWPWQLPAIAVGEATASVLREAGLSVLVPEQEDSEGVLALPELAEPAGRRILIVRGEGGRELLATTLRARGATVDVAELYRRDLPAMARPVWAALAEQDWPQVVTLSSPAVWEHWQLLAGADSLQPWLLTVSPRLADTVQAAGGRVIAATGPRPEQMRDALLHWRASGLPDMG